MKLLSGKILYRILGQTLQRRNVEEMELNEYIQNVFLPIFLACLIIILHLLSLMSSIIYAFLHIYLYVYIFKNFLESDQNARYLILVIEEKADLLTSSLQITRRVRK